MAGARGGDLELGREAPGQKLRFVIRAVQWIGSARAPLVDEHDVSLPAHVSEGFRELRTGDGRGLAGSSDQDEERIRRWALREGWHNGHAQAQLPPARRLAIFEDGKLRTARFDSQAFQAARNTH